MIIIIGGGISGLNVGIKLLDKYEDVVIYEKSNYLGGRIYTMNHKIGQKKIQYESAYCNFLSSHVH